MASVVQHKVTKNTNFAASPIFTFTSGIANSTIFCGIAVSGGGGSTNIISIVGCGASWLLVKSSLNNTDCELWIGTGAVANRTTVSVNFTGPGLSGNVEIVEVSGIATSPVATSNNHSNNVDPADTGTINTGNPNDFLIGVIAMNGDQVGSSTMGGGFTQLDLSNAATGIGSTGAYGYRIVSSTGSYKMTLTNPNATAWDGVLAAYNQGANTYSVSTSMNVTSAMNESDLSTYKSVISLSGHPAYASDQGSSYATTELLHATPVFATSNKEALLDTVIF